jgi:hypothetical protein
MREISIEIEINAPAARVWEILTDFARYPQWNPFIPDIEGRLVVGERLRVLIRPPGGKGMTFRPVVLVAQPPSELRWLGRLLLPGIFDGEHRFQIEELGGGRVRLRQSEQFRGILVPILWSRMGTPTRRGFESMNLAIKDLAEKG